MNTPKWTPGPLTMRESQMSGRFYVEAPHTSGQVWLVAEVSGRSREENAANAARFAAVDDLYDTLARTRTRMARYGESIAELGEIDAALAKARGESQNTEDK